jgi:hypothetical protein
MCDACSDFDEPEDSAGIQHHSVQSKGCPNVRGRRTETCGLGHRSVGQIVESCRLMIAEARAVLWEGSWYQ